MAIEEKITREDLILYEVLRNPVFCNEFIRNIDLDPEVEPVVMADYQVKMACDFATDVSITTARSVGKTFTLTGLLMWAMINNIYPQDPYIVYSVPNKVHLKPVWNELVTYFRNNSLLKNFIPRSSGINASDNEISLLNGTKLMCRISGNDGTGKNVMGLHTPLFIVDEAAVYEWRSWIELQPTLNRFRDGHRMIVCGVPIGLREENVLYTVDQVLDDFTKHRATSLQNPRYTEEDHRRDMNQYGGEDSDDYKRNVLGQHGTPTFAIFDRALMKFSNYPVFKLVMDGIKMRDDISDYFQKLATLPQVPAESQETIIGVDLGYTEPTAIVVMYRNRHGQFKFHARIQLNKVAYPLQTRIIDYLDSKYKPTIIGIDEGSTGFSEIQRMKMDRTLVHKNYEERIIPIAFQSKIDMGTDQDGNEISQMVKPFSVTLLQEYSNSHRIVYTSTDLDLVAELERMTYMRTQAGNQVYRTLSKSGGGIGEDHFTSALLCATLGYYMTKEMVGINPRTKKLMSPSWGFQ